MKRNKLNNVLKAYFLLSGKLRLTGFLFFCLIQICFSQSNTDTQQYDLNDPRNPDCPCHKYQKMADDEYAKLKKKNKNKQQQEISDDENFKNSDIGKIQFNEIKHPANRVDSGFTNKRKRKKVKALVHQISFFTRGVKKRKIKPDYSVCFKW